MIWRQIIAVAVGLTSGTVVSGAVFAFISAIGVVPRLANRTHTRRKIIIYEEAIIFGGIFGCLTMLINFSLPMNDWLVAALSLLVGVFIGALAMSLAETLDVLPILARRLAIKKGMGWFVAALALGKLAGSLIYFVINGFFEPN